jgi:hypothetical protein
MEIHIPAERLRGRLGGPPAVPEGTTVAGP